MAKHVYGVLASWDEEAHGWALTSDQIPGLALGASTTDEIEKKLRLAIPALLRHNLKFDEVSDVEIRVHYDGDQRLTLTKQAA